MSAELQHAADLLAAERARLVVELADHQHRFNACVARLDAIDASLAALTKIDIAPAAPATVEWPADAGDWPAVEPDSSPGPADPDPELERLLDEEERIAREHPAKPAAPAAVTGPTVELAPGGGDPTAEPGPPVKHAWGTAPDYVEVARVINRARREGRYTRRAVCDHFQVKETTAANWMTKCRNLGLLVEPDGNGALTPPSAPVEPEPPAAAWTTEPITRDTFDPDAVRDAAATALFGSSSGPMPDAAAPTRPAPAPPAERPLDPVRVWTPEDAAALIDSPGSQP